ncbi:MAG: alpha/beta hydrolase fold domain-containing protein [Gemmatimonadales bacterium]
MNDSELNHLLREWKAPDAPSHLRPRGTRRPRLRRLVAGTIRVPVLAPVAALALVVVWLASSRTDPTSAVPAAGTAGQGDPAVWALSAPDDYRVIADVPYLTTENGESRLDLYVPRGGGPRPTVLYFHGGFWVRGSKEANVLQLLPYLEMGWAVVNVGYRLGRVAPAPAAVEDARCALHWVARNATQYGFDASRIVVTGHSAGGHLSLTTGMLSREAGLDELCPGTDGAQVAAVVDWYGPTDVGALLSGANGDLVAEWLGNMPDRLDVAARVSPINLVRAGLPPILTVHGEDDMVVPYENSVELHDALERAGVRHELVNVPGGGHGDFTRAQTAEIFERIREFLADQGLTAQP